MTFEFISVVRIFEVFLVSCPNHFQGTAAAFCWQELCILMVANCALEPDQAGSLFVKYPVLWYFMERSTVPERQKGQLI